MLYKKKKLVRRQLPSQLNRFTFSLLLLLGILAVGTGGYMLIEKSSFMDGLYMTVISITTVGYGEVVPLGFWGRIFTMLLMLTGVGFVLYVFSEVTEAVVEGGIRKSWRRVKMTNALAKLEEHYIVCGYGRIGKDICKILHDSGRRSFVVIENDHEKIDSIVDSGYLVLEGDAADDEILLTAGIMKAKGLITVLSSDATNVYTTLSAKGMRPDLFIMARSSGDKGAETKLLRAGADKVISPYFIGATRMAQQIVRPTVIDFIDLTVHGGQLGLRLEELYVSAEAKVQGPLMESGIRKDYDLIVVAIKRSRGEMLFNPNPTTVLQAGDTLVVLGDSENITRLEKAL